MPSPKISRNLAASLVHCNAIGMKANSNMEYLASNLQLLFCNLSSAASKILIFFYVDAKSGIS